MQTDRHKTRKWEIFLGLLFVISFLGVTFALTVRDAIATPDSSNFTITTTPDQNFLK